MQFFVTSWTVVHQVSLSMGILQARILERVAIPSSRDPSRGSSQPRDWTQVSRIAGGFFTIWATREARINSMILQKVSISLGLQRWKGLRPYKLYDDWILLKIDEALKN